MTHGDGSILVMGLHRSSIRIQCVYSMYMYILYYIYILVGGDWNHGILNDFHSVGNVIIPTDEVHHFSEG